MARLAPVMRAVEGRLGARLEIVGPYGEGVDSFVDEVVLADGGRAVLRTSKVERLQTSYDGWVDSAEVLGREIAAAELLAAAGVRVPRVLAWSRGSADSGERSWLLAELIEHVGFDTLDAEAQRQLGAIARRVHAIIPTGTHQRTLTVWDAWEPWVVERILRRIDAARAYVELPERDTVRPRLARAVAGRGAHADRLLHLDLRPPNLAIVGGSIEALFDFGNAICGDPYFELARVQQCDLLTPAFRTGYGLSRQELDAHAELMCAYSLDVTALLVAVSREECDEPVLHDVMKARTSALIATLLDRPV